MRQNVRQMATLSNPEAEYPNRKQRLLANIPPMSPFHPRSTINPIMPGQDNVITISDDDEDNVFPNNNGPQEQQPYDDLSQYHHVPEFHPQAQESYSPIHQVPPSRQTFQSQGQKPHLPIKPFPPTMNEEHQPIEISKSPIPKRSLVGQEVSKSRYVFQPPRHRIQPKGHRIRSPRHNVLFRGHGSLGLEREAFHQGHGALSPVQEMLHDGQGGPTHNGFHHIDEAPSSSNVVPFQGHRAPSSKHKVLPQGHRVPGPEQQMHHEGQGGPMHNGFHSGHEAPSSSYEVSLQGHRVPSSKHNILPQGHRVPGPEQEMLHEGQGGPMHNGFHPGHEAPSSSYVVPFQGHRAPSSKNNILPQGHGAPNLQQEILREVHGAPSSWRQVSSQGYGVLNPMQDFQQTGQVSLIRRQSNGSHSQYVPSTTAYQQPPTCKVVQKLSDDTWIELDVSCDGQSLEQVSKAIKQFVTSYNQVSPVPKDSEGQCRCQKAHTCPPGQSPVVQETPQVDQVETTTESPAEPNQLTLSDELIHPVCSICQAPAESAHLNYGAHSCFSCRAFFRRSVQIEIYPNFDCLFDRQCLITPGNRSQCRKCRFEKCLKQGMKISAVLNQAQKRTRFRKQLSLKRMDQMNKLKVELRTFRKKIAPK